MTTKEIPWTKIKKDYVLGTIDNNGLKHFPTYKELSKKYNVSEGLKFMVNLIQWFVSVGTICIL